MAVKNKSVLPSKEIGSAVLFHFTDDGFVKEWPGLYEFLAAATVDGVARKGGSVSVFAQLGKLKACLLDKHTQMAKYVDLTPSASLLSQLEAALYDGTNPWAPVKASPGKIPF